MSERWVKIFTYADGMVESYDQNAWFHSADTRWFDFSQRFVNCCSTISSNSGPSGSFGGSGEYDMEIDGNDITVYCPYIISSSNYNQLYHETATFAIYVNSSQSGWLP